MILADAALSLPSGVTGGDAIKWLLVAVFFLSAWERIEKFLSRRRGDAEPREIKPSPLIVSPHTRMATHEELTRTERVVEAIQKKIEDGFSKLQEDMKELATTDLEERRLLHNKVNAHHGVLQFLAGKMIGAGEPGGEHIRATLHRSEQKEGTGV